MSVTLPYVNVLKRTNAFSSSGLDKVLRECISLSERTPCYLEIKEGTVQLYMFFREKQIYAAGKIQNQQIKSTSIKEFLLGCYDMQTPTLTCFEVDNKILHSILIIFQKKPSIKILTSLVDLDKLLDRIEEDGKSCIVNASQDDFLAILRYEKGKVTALCHEHSLPHPKEETFRDDFLVKIYTLSAEKQLMISLYEDLLVQFATDAKLIDDSYSGSIVDLFLSKPPTVVLRFKGKEIGKWSLDKAPIKIGRTPDNDIIIDNLAVSRLHALLEEDKGSFYIKDCDSLNGTSLNGKKIGRAKLEDGDEIVIGKHTITFYKQEGRSPVYIHPPEELDQTVMMTRRQHGNNTKPRADINALGPVHEDSPILEQHVSARGARLLEKTSEGERIIELEKSNLTFGSDPRADIIVEGFLVAKRQAEIIKENDHYIIRRLKGPRRIRVDGKPVRETVLKPNDRIKIANKEFIFLG